MWYKKKGSITEENNPWEQINVSVPKKTHQKLVEICKEKKIPLSRACAIAIDNEFDSINPFNFPCEFPDSEYQPYLYTKEAGLILSFLMKLPGGTGIDSLMLCRREIGVEDRETMMLALRELLEKDLAELYTNFKASQGYASDRPLVRYKNIDPDTGKRIKKFKKFEGESLAYKRRITDDQIKREKDGE